MLRYIIKRLLQFIPVFLGVTLLLFFISYHMPGVDPAQMRMGERAVTPEFRAQFEAAHGFDQPWYVQYVNYLGNLVQGDLGRSYMSGRAVADTLADRYPYTLRLALVAVAIQAVLGIGAGIISAVKRRSFWDVLVTISTSLAVSVPVFWLGLILQFVFGIWLQNITGGAVYLPVTGASGSMPTWMYYILPGFTLAVVSLAYTARIMRSQLLEVSNADYVRTAKAKGCSPARILWGHKMKNALIPVVTSMGVDFGIMLSGAIFTETVFNWPGIGLLLFTAITQRDFQVIVGVTTVILFIIMFISLIVDIAYGFLDPRIRIAGGEE
ncbi:MAG: ABC transporter permease [Coriobacteriia bacterium]|nr:ABC transporter permease [Coriobacteriia bacterium]MCL2745739.1 ABC transporter permease [Coriobacteriia bacterium]MCL2870866.1 ABC transporter permease [Coriobacteriia bacterium]